MTSTTPNGFTIGRLTTEIRGGVKMPTNPEAPCRNKKGDQEEKMIEYPNVQGVSGFVGILTPPLSQRYVDQS